GWHQPTCHFLHLERLDHITGFDVVEILEPDAAFETGSHLAHVLLEAAQTRDLAFEDRYAVSDQSHARGAGDLAFRDLGSGDGPHAGNREGAPHLGTADDLFPDRRRQQT